MVALLLAAGSGQRLGSVIPKAFIELAGRPMLEWSLDLLASSSKVTSTVIALPRDYQYRPAGKVTTVSGGHTRSHSVKSALAAAPASDFVLVHDAARPLVTAGHLLDLVTGIKDCDAATLAVPVTDTIKLADEDNLVKQTLDRSSLWAVQTPQLFRREALERALALSDKEIETATDDASLVERCGGKVKVVISTTDNIKVTTKRDLVLAELMLKERLRG